MCLLVVGKASGLPMVGSSTCGEGLWQIQGWGGEGEERRNAFVMMLVRLKRATEVLSFCADIVIWIGR